MKLTCIEYLYSVLVHSCVYVVLPLMLHSSGFSVDWLKEPADYSVKQTHTCSSTISPRLIDLSIKLMMWMKNTLPSFMFVHCNTQQASLAEFLIDAPAQWPGQRNRTMRLCLHASRPTIELHSEEALHNLAFLLLAQRRVSLIVYLHVSC